MDYISIILAIVLSVQSIVLWKQTKNIKKKISNLDNELRNDMASIEDKTSEHVAITRIEYNNKMKELNVFSHELAKLQREEFLNVHTKINDLQKRVVKFANTVLENDIELKEAKKNIMLVARNPSKARRKLSKDE